MGQTLIIASEKDAYILADRGTYVTLKPNLRLTILHERDPQLINTYSIIRVNPRKSSRINGAGAKAFLDFMLLSDTLKMIGEYGLEKYGVPLFQPLGRKGRGE
jgi:tungstate transport system substrate-binding protein